MFPYSNRLKSLQLSSSDANQTLDLIDIAQARSTASQLETYLSRGMWSWSPGDVSVWLITNGFENYVETFAATNIDGSRLLFGLDDDLKCVSIDVN